MDSTVLLLLPILGALYYAVLGFLEATGSGEKPDPMKALATVLVGGAIAGYYTIAGQPLTSENLIAALMLETGTIVTVQKGIVILVSWVTKAAGLVIHVTPSTQSTPSPTPQVMSEIVVVADRQGLFVNIARTMPYPQQSVQEVHHVPLGLSMTGSFPVVGAAIYLVTLVDISGLYGSSFGGARERDGLVPEGKRATFIIPSLPDSSGRMPPASVTVT